MAAGLHSDAFPYALCIFGPVPLEVQAERQARGQRLEFALQIRTQLRIAGFGLGKQVGQT